MARINRHRFMEGIKQISVEPILFLSMLSTQFSQVVQQVGIYKVICQQMYVSSPEINCNHLGNTTVNGVPAENAVQQKMVMWNMALGIAYLAPALFADVFLGAYGDRHGRKVNMLLGITGLMISLYPLAIQFTYPLKMPLYILVIAHVITGFTGFISITMISAFAYIADTVLDSETLTIRMAIMSVTMHLATIVGPLLAGTTSKTLTHSQEVLVCQVILASGFFLCLFLIRQIPPAQLRRMLKEKRDKEQAKSAAIDGGHQMKSLKAPAEPGPHFHGGSTVADEKEPFCKMIGTLLKESWRTFTKPREGNARLYLIICALVFFLNIISEMGIRTTIFTLFVQKAPLSWDEEMIGYFKTSQSAMLMAGTMFGVLIFKKVFKFTDTFIVLIASISHVSETLIMAFTRTTWMAYLAAAAGSLSGMAMPCTQSFLAKQVGTDEVGKAYTAFGISANIGFLVSNAIYSPIYSATVSFFPGFVFLFASALLGIAVFAVLWLHIDFHFKSQGPDVEFKKKLVRSIFSATTREMATAKVTPVDVAAAKMQIN